MPIKSAFFNKASRYHLGIGLARDFLASFRDLENYRLTPHWRNDRLQGKEPDSGSSGFNGLVEILTLTSMAMDSFGETFSRARQGDVEAQYSLSLMFAKGLGITKNVPKAVYWCRKAAQNGHAQAQFNLGLMYRTGRGVHADYIEAVEWYLRSARQGHARAQHNLAFMFEHGKGVDQDYAAAAKWYFKAAEQGLAEAQLNLGILYSKGLGVPRNYPMAIEWYRKAADQGNRKAKQKLRELLTA
jgi:TPR repeat protein